MNDAPRSGKSTPRRYPAYKDSGVEWIGAVPEHWTQTKLKYVLADIGTGGTPSTSREDYWADNGIPWVAISDMTAQSIIMDTAKAVSKAGLSAARLQVLPRGTLLISIFASLGKTSVLGVDAAVNQAILGLVPSPQLDRAFLQYNLKALNPFISYYSSSNTQENLNLTKIRNLDVSLPPPEEQRQLAAYLDRKTAQIDALIAQKQALIALLREQRTAVINRAITKGLDPDAPMRESGVKWIGDIPEHWELQQLRYLVPADRGIMYGIVLPGPHYEGGIPIVKASSCLPGRMKLSEMKRTDPEIEARYERSRLKADDIVISIRGSYGSPALVPEYLDGANLTQDAARISPRYNVDSKWLFYALGTPYVQGYLDSRLAGATVKGINIWDLQRTQMVIPPHTEQIHIAQHLDLETARLDGAIQRERKLMLSLRQLRISLISEVVTGKIDVRRAEVEA